MDPDSESRAVLTPRARRMNVGRWLFIRVYQCSSVV